MNTLCIKVKRKGLNYYTDFIFRYINKTAENFGYHLVLNPQQAEYKCCIYHNESPWMIILSDVFNHLPYNELLDLSCIISTHFKSQTIIESIELSSLPKYLPCLCYFSKQYNAFMEPPFLTEGIPCLAFSMFDAQYNVNKSICIFVQNYGGISRGLAINIMHDIYNKGESLFENISIGIFNKINGREIIPCSYETIISGDKFYYNIRLPDFIIPEGINQYSLKLSGKKMQDEKSRRSFAIFFTPLINDIISKDVIVEIYPINYPKHKAVWKLGTFPFPDFFFIKIVVKKYAGLLKKYLHIFVFYVPICSDQDMASTPLHTPLRSIW